MKKYLLILVCLLTLQGTDFAMSRNMKGDLKIMEVLRPIDSEEIDKPIFISVTVDTITLTPGSVFYSLDLTVICSGAESLYVEQSEEFGVFMNTHTFDTPHIVHLHYEHIHMDGRVWIVLELKNKAGTTSYTVEIPSQMKPDSIEEVTMESSISQVEVRDIQGRLVLQTENYEDINRLSRGMYIVTITYSDGKVVTRKICQ